MKWFIDRDPNWFIRRVNEAIHIRLNKPQQHQQREQNRNSKSMDVHHQEVQQQESLMSRFLEVWVFRFLFSGGTKFVGLFSLVSGFLLRFNFSSCDFLIWLDLICCCCSTLQWNYHIPLRGIIIIMKSEERLISACIFSFCWSAHGFLLIISLVFILLTLGLCLSIAHLYSIMLCHPKWQT